MADIQQQPRRLDRVSRNHHISCLLKPPLAPRGNNGRRCTTVLIHLDPPHHRQVADFRPGGIARGIQVMSALCFAFVEQPSVQKPR